jgi:hypothetical protein
MIDPIPTPAIQYPIFFPTDSVQFEILDTEACELLGFPDAGANNYCNPIIDIDGVYYFTVNPEVLSLFTQSELDSCVPYDEIVLPPNPPLKK